MDTESVKNFLIHGISGFMIPDSLSLLNKKEKFENIDTVLIVVIVILLTIFIVLTVVEAVATYRLMHGSVWHTIFCILFGFVYIGIMWIYYGLNNKKLVKN